MTITVIGHLCLDLHHFSEKQQPEERFGGIMYSLTTLANLMSENDTIYPVFPVGKNEYQRTQEFLSRYPNIDTSGMYQIDSPTNHVMLFYHENGNSRTECSKDISPAIPWTRIKPYLNTDAILVNMVSGYDISLETFDLLRMEIREKQTPIHFDFHSLTLGIDEHAKRFRRPLFDWRRWCFFVNSIQLSEEEAAGLTAERYDEPTFINQLMPLMVHDLLITRSERGATLVHQSNKKLIQHNIPGIVNTQIVDPTGCGDVFGAAYLYQYIKSNDVLQAVTVANRVAAYKATVRGPEAMDSLKEHFTQEISV